ncbi:HAD family hydrolase [Streptomyces alkaliphilus]|uniref:HAD family hydrolase n=1 Tax=Streptomyces alkaliphilus TaxID=1472722 RepID=UPI0015FA0FDD|nr:HAD-IB family hydrolase [Streptomyces alkaliphilus]
MSRVAFFDVDHTLTTVVGMFRFLEYRLALTGHPPGVFRDHMRHLEALRVTGAPRSETGSLYFSWYAGADREELLEQGEEWFRRELDNGGFFNPWTVRALEEHRNGGDVVVLVSGSFSPCLDPLARYLGADVVLCSCPEERAGRLTGRLSVQMLGPTKEQAMRHLLEGLRVSPARCVSYGDHESDLPMLRLTGEAVVVGGDPVLHAVGRTSGWKFLPATEAAPPLPLPVGARRIGGRR